MIAAANTREIAALVKTMTLGPNYEMRKVRPILRDLAFEVDAIHAAHENNAAVAELVRTFRAEERVWNNVRTRASLIRYLESALSYVLRLRALAA